MPPAESSPDRRVRSLVARFEQATAPPLQHARARRQSSGHLPKKSAAQAEPTTSSYSQLHSNPRSKESDSESRDAEYLAQAGEARTAGISEEGVAADHLPRLRCSKGAAYPKASVVKATDIIELKTLPHASVQCLPGGSSLPHQGSLAQGNVSIAASDLPARKARFIQPPPRPQRPAAVTRVPSRILEPVLPAVLEEHSPENIVVAEIWQGKDDSSSEAKSLLPSNPSTPFSTPPKRPSMPNSKSSGAISSATMDIPAYNVFSRKALPLNLPYLDRYLASIPKFAFTDSEKLLGPQETKAWHTFVEAPQSVSFGQKIKRFFGSAKSMESEQASLDDTTPKDMSPRDVKRSILPPMYLLPTELTLDDLKLNNRSLAPLLTLSSLLGTVIDGILGIEGSTYAANLMNIEVLRDCIQMLGLALNFTQQPSPLRSTDDPRLSVHSGNYTTSFSDWRTVTFSTVPSVLGLDFVSAFGMALIFFWLFVVVCGWALYEFFIMTGGFKGWHEQDDNGEAFDRSIVTDQSTARHLGHRLQRLRQSRNYRMTIVFLITSLYVPLSKISIDALSWADSFWPVDNPYLISDFPDFPPNSNATLFRNPADFCYTTTMYQPDGLLHFNWAWLIIPVAFATVVVLTVWFPWRLYFTVKKMVPRVDKYTELGEKRKDLATEYQRLVETDRSPLAFMYNFYRRKWSGFKSIYMVVKLANVLCVCLISKDTCLFRGMTRSRMNVICEAVQLTIMIVFFVFDTMAGPYIDSLSNNSDWVSRITYVLISLYGLLLALNVPGRALLDGSLLLMTTVICYTLNIYFSLINTQFAQRLVKTFQRRLDFSIDFGSPQLDCQKHITRRIWQESISTLLLAGSDFRMDEQKKLAFARLEKSAPYLLNFGGTVAERHVENIKILREIGLEAYVEAMEAVNEASPESLKLRQIVIEEFSGPDCYFCPQASSKYAALASHFGRAVVVPFPFVVVFYYDLGGTITIVEDSEVEALVIQNRADAIQEARKVRRMIRALKNQRVYAPHKVSEWANDRHRFLPWRKRRVSYQHQTQYTYGRLIIEHNSKIRWQGHNLSSGFNVKIEYSEVYEPSSNGEKQPSQRKVIVQGNALGVNSDFRLDVSLARLFRHNQNTIREKLPIIDETFRAHRSHLAQEYRAKLVTLSYAFLVTILGEDGLTTKELEERLQQTEMHEGVRQMPYLFNASIQATIERMRCVSRSTTTQRWFLIWDDLYRRNRTTIPQLKKYAQSFSPYYRTSICYRPMPRAALINWLEKHELETGQHSFFHPGFINCIYFVIDEIVFRDSARVIPVVVHSTPVAFDKLSVANATWSGSNKMTASAISSQTFDTGNGTSHDDPNIRPRHAFPFEEAYDQASIPWKRGFLLRKMHQKVSRVGEHAMRWFGLSPVEHCHNAPGIALRLRVSKNAEFEVSQRHPSHSSLSL